MNLAHVQSCLRQQKLGGWLVHDFRGNNPTLARLLPGKRWTTRRVDLFIPAEGKATLLVHAIDSAQFQAQFKATPPDIALTLEIYTSWQQLEGHLRQLVKASGRVAMEYSPLGALPVAGIVDAGTVELVRSLGGEVVSSADLIQSTIAVWSAEARANHAKAAAGTERAKSAAFEAIRAALASGQTVTEIDVQAVMVESFRRDGLEATEPPIVAVSALGS
jgi:Xaa-Pro dipeptidase